MLILLESSKKSVAIFAQGNSWICGGTEPAEMSRGGEIGSKKDKMTI